VIHSHLRQCTKVTAEKWLILITSRQKGIRKALLVKHILLVEQVIIHKRLVCGMIVGGGNSITIGMGR
jgi:hypothetical protein